MGIQETRKYKKKLKRGGHCFALDHKESLKILLFYVHNENVTFFSDKMHTKQVNLNNSLFVIFGHTFFGCIFAPM